MKAWTKVYVPVAQQLVKKVFSHVACFARQEAKHDASHDSEQLVLRLTMPAEKISNKSPQRKTLNPFLPPSETPNSHPSMVCVLTRRSASGFRR